MSGNCKSLVLQDKCNIEIFLSPATILIENTRGECLLISSFPGNALRTLVDIIRLAE